MALAELKGEYERQTSQALLLGSFVDELLTGTKKSKEKFIEENRSELFKKNGEPYADVAKAMETVELVKKQPLMMKHFKSRHQTIMVGEIAGVPFKIKMDNYNVAAKTGTSIKPKENGVGYTNKLYTSIVGYLPATDPQVLIYVIVDSAQGYEIWGNTVAAPIFKEISTQVAHILNLQPDKK